MFMGEVFRELYYPNGKDGFAEVLLTFTGAVFDNK
jgi:hypothetical protein